MWLISDVMYRLLRTYQLSEEMQEFLRNIQMAMKIGDSSKQIRITRSLSGDSGLQELVPYISQLISSRISILVRIEASVSTLSQVGVVIQLERRIYYLKRKISHYLLVLQLYFLVHLADCLLVNRHFHYVDVYLHQILPALMTVVLHSGYTPPGEEVCMYDLVIYIYIWVGYLLLLYNV